jgi:hypothetical protein
MIINKRLPAVYRGELALVAKDRLNGNNGIKKN